MDREWKAARQSSSLPTAERPSTCNWSLPLFGRSDSCGRREMKCMKAQMNVNCILIICPMWVTIVSLNWIDRYPPTHSFRMSAPAYPLGAVSPSPDTILPWSCLSTPHGHLEACPALFREPEKQVRMELFRFSWAHRRYSSPLGWWMGWLCWSILLKTKTCMCLR